MSVRVGEWVVAATLPTGPMGVTLAVIAASVLLFWVMGLRDRSRR